MLASLLSQKVAELNQIMASKFRRQNMIFYVTYIVNLLLLVILDINILYCTASVGKSDKLNIW